MKDSIAVVTTVTTFTLIAVFVFSGCDSPSNKMVRAETSAFEASRDWEIANAEVDADYRIYKLEKEIIMMEYDRTIEHLKHKINNVLDREVRVMLDTKLDECDANHRKLKREINSYNVTEKENLDVFKESINIRMDEIGNSLKDILPTSNTIYSTFQP